MTDTQRSIFGLQSAGDLIRSAGCRPNRRYAAALRALRKLDQEAGEYVKPEGTLYDVALTNGRTIELFVPKGHKVAQVALMKGYEVYSFSKKA